MSASSSAYGRLPLAAGSSWSIAPLRGTMAGRMPSSLQSQGSSDALDIWYGGDEEGYTDYETYEESSGKEAMSSLT